MPHYTTQIAERMSRAAVKKRTEERLKKALGYRPVSSVLKRRITVFNPDDESERVVELRHELNCGAGKYNVYIDGEKWRNGWSKSRFGKWIAEQIDKGVRNDPRR